MNHRQSHASCCLSKLSFKHSNCIRSTAAQLLMYSGGRCLLFANGLMLEPALNRNTR